MNNREQTVEILNAVKKIQENQNEVKRIVPLALDQLVIHPTDSQVKPIIGNNEIEKPQQLQFDAKTLNFKAIAFEQVDKNLETHQIENHFAEIYNQLRNFN